MIVGGLVVMLLLLLVGAGLIFVAVIGAQSKSKAITSRVDRVAAVRIDKPRRSPPVGQWLAAIDGTFQAAFSFRRVHEWGTRSHALTLLLIGLVAGTGAWSILHGVLLLPVWLVTPVAIGAFLGGPHIKLSLEQAKAEALFTDRFPDAIDSIIRMLRAGLPISAAIRAVAAEPSPPVDAVFRMLADQMDIGVTLEQALADASQRIDLADFRFFAVAVALQHSTGGNLTTTLDILSEIIRKRRAMRLKASAVTAEVRMTSYVLASIPLVIVAGLLVINPGYLGPMIHDPRGNMIIAGAVGSLTLGFLTMRQMMRHAIRL
jgi:tight adherence protein B